MIAAAQRVDHYEMAGYGCARTYAELLGDKKGARLLETTLREEEATDLKLTKLAKTVINLRAKKAPNKNEREQRSTKKSGVTKTIARLVEKVTG